MIYGFFSRNARCSYPHCGRRLLLLLLVAFAATLVIGAPAANAAAGPLTISRITWNVVGLDSNSAGSGPNTYQVGSKVCNTGSSTATNATVTWYWGASGVTTGSISSNSFNGPAESSTISVGSLAGGACQQVYFTVTVHPASGAFNNNADYWVQATADGGTSIDLWRKVMRSILTVSYFRFCILLVIR